MQFAWLCTTRHVAVTQPLKKARGEHTHPEVSRRLHQCVGHEQPDMLRTAGGNVGGSHVVHALARLRPSTSRQPVNVFTVLTTELQALYDMLGRCSDTTFIDIIQLWPLREPICITHGCGKRHTAWCLRVVDASLANLHRAVQWDGRCEAGNCELPRAIITVDCNLLFLCLRGLWSTWGFTGRTLFSPLCPLKAWRAPEEEQHAMDVHVADGAVEPVARAEVEVPRMTALEIADCVRAWRMQLLNRNAVVEEDEHRPEPRFPKSPQ